MIARAWRTWVELWDRREPPTALALVRITIALVFIGRMWGQAWVLHESCALTGCQPASMAFIGWATEAALPAFGLVAISGQRRTRAGRRRLWIVGVLIFVPGLMFLPGRNDPWFDLAFHGAAGPRAFGVGLIAAWVALVSLVPVLLVVFWFEDKAYLRARQHRQVSAEGSSSIRMNLPRRETPVIVECLILL